MSPLGKFTLALLGLRFFGAAGFFWGLFLGHVIIDRTFIIKKIENQLTAVDDNIRLMLPYTLSRYYNRIGGNFWGKIWGSIFGSVLYGINGFIFLFIVGHFVFDTPDSRHANRFRNELDALFSENLAKILGAVVGFSLNSRLLIFCGVIIGFFIDYYRQEKDLKTNLSFFRRLLMKINPLRILWSSFALHHSTLLQMMTALAAKISKADGVVSENEIRTFKSLFNIPEQEKKRITKIFNQAKQTANGYERYAKRLKLLSKDNLDLKEDIIENLFKIACTDSLCNDKELTMLKNIARIIELPDGNFEVIKKIFEPKDSSSATVQDFYAVLGIFRNASDSEIKRRWKELINVYHPDKLQARGASLEELEETTIKMAEINNAYQSIMKSRRAA